ncbi:LmbE family N-acetylglucosaminyl deacetylase [Streptomyces sp. V4I23]|uniref:PIG-L family deacetylase n=1 Tax=Streptomyces sp. V4I23 TaxID=3042282 RepID=UPI00278AF289|nr:PIG-L family deacetylase [Streptomyces sp. V4I23]MDQ1007670.1 LmbE family N-acetylglucosaminyl deacetylase [Streptomyces sp. V4I23]
MGRATREERRPAGRGRRKAAPRRTVAGHSAQGVGGRGGVLHVVAHPADVLFLTGAEAGPALSEPGRPLTVVCLAAGDAAGRAALLDALCAGAGWSRRGERLPDGTPLDIHTLSPASRTEVCFVDAAGRLARGAEQERARLAAALLERFPAAVLRTTDPDPEHIAWDAEVATYADHPEHTAVAEAVLEAVRLRADRPETAGLVVECFRAAAPCDEPGAPGPAVNRYPGRRVWLTRGTDGRLAAYAAVGGGIVRWTEERPGGPGWTEWRSPDTPSLLPVLSVAQSPEGWVHLVSLRRTPDPAGGALVEVMHAVQYQSGRPAAPWRSLGNPNGSHPVKSREVGVPAVVVDADGCPHLFARNFGRGVSSRSQAKDGSWGGWTDRQGSGVTDGLAAVLDDQGGPEVFAPSDEGVLRWHRAPDGDGLVRSPHSLPLLPVPGSPLTAQPTGGGRVTVYGSDARDGALWALRTDGAATRIGGAGGAGVTLARAAIDGYDCTVLLQRAPEGETAIAAYPTEHEPSDLWWERTGGQGVREPAAAVDAYGRLVVASLDPDGRLRVARQDTTAPGLLLGGWVTV